MMIENKLRWAFCLLLLISFASCMDLATNVEPETKTDEDSEISFNNVTWNDIRFLKGETNNLELDSNNQSDYACLISYDAQFDNKYTYEALWLHFPDAILNDAKGEETTIIYQLSLENSSKTQRFARCTIPASEEAISYMRDQLRINNSDTDNSNMDSNNDNVLDNCTQVIETIMIYQVDGTWYIGQGYICNGTGFGDDSNGSDPDPIWPPNEPTEETGGGNWNPGGNEDDDPCSDPNSLLLPASCVDVPETPCIGDPVPNPQIAPTSGQGISGGRYGAHRNHGNTHKGLDLKADLNSNVYAMYSGTVFAINKDPNVSSFGKFVIIEHSYNGEKIFILYAHLNKVSVMQNQFLSSGFNIGLSGNTGNADNAIPHLHIEVRKNVRELGYNNSPHFDPEKYMTTKFNQDGNAKPNNCNNS